MSLTSYPGQSISILPIPFSPILCSPILFSLISPILCLLIPCSPMPSSPIPITSNLFVCKSVYRRYIPSIFRFLLQICYLFAYIYVYK